MRKKERAAIVIERLKKEYPGADCTLDYNEAWKLLVSVRLAAQCTDERVNIIVKDLFAKYPGVNELAEAEPEDIEAIVRPCGLLILFLSFASKYAKANSKSPVIVSKYRGYNILTNIDIIAVIKIVVIYIPSAMYTGLASFLFFINL